MPNESRTAAAIRQREVFLSALEKAPSERAAFLDSACGDDQALRRQVEELLCEEPGVGSFLETPAAAGAGRTGTALIETVTEKPGDRIGRYKLLQKIGEGGCGVVYMAEQEEPVRRRVALKIIKLGMDTKSVIARFEAERQALAMMDHPNIAKVLDAGATETGRPYFVMELVRGIKITEYCDQNNLPTEERLQLFIHVCQAIQHAHQKGVIHRDIKPSNILVTLHDSVPVPKVIDFGIAKATEQRLTDKTLFTEFQSFIGTPAYMSPEQAEMSGLDIDTRSDIYALGVLLYEFLTGKTPFDAATLLRAGIDECRRTIREDEPARPSTRLATMVDAELTTTASQRRTDAPRLIHLLRGDLDWIVMKCLEKDRTRRYDAAHDVALDVQRYLDDEPVLARPPSNVYRLQKILRRHRGAFAAAAAIAFILIVGSIVSAWLTVRAIRAEHRAQASEQKERALREQAEQESARAEQEKASARLNEYIADINLAQQNVRAGNLGRAVQLLEKHLPRAGERDLRGFEWRYLRHLCQGDEHVSLPIDNGPASSLAVSPNGELLALGQGDKVTIWNLRSQSLTRQLARGGGSVVFVPNRAVLITAGGFGPAPGPMPVRVWRTDDWTEQAVLRGSSGPIAVSQNGTRAATGGRDGVRIWDTSTWQELRTLPEAHPPFAFSPDGKRLVSSTREGNDGLVVWNLDRTTAELTLEHSTNVFGSSGPWFKNDRSLAFSPDGSLIVAARNTLSERGVFVLSVWNVETGHELRTMPKDPAHEEHTGMISSIAFSPDGQTFATASMDHSVRLWAITNGQCINSFQGHLSEVADVAFLPDGKTLVSAAGNSVKLWPVRQKQSEEGPPGTWQPLAISPDSRTLAALSRDGSAVAFLNLANGELEQQLQLDSRRFRFFSSATVMSSVSISEDLKTLVHALEDGSVKLWNVETRETNTIKVSEWPVDFVFLSPDAGTLVTGGFRRHARLWDLRNGTNTTLNTEAHRAVFSPDGRLLATAERGGTLQLWDVATRLLRTNVVMEAPGGFDTFSFSPNGRVLAVAGSNDTIRLLDVATGAVIGTCTGHKQSVSSITFSPDGKTLATASDDSTLKLWNVATQQELLTERRLGGALRSLTFSPDGQLLVGGGSFTLQTGGLRFYRAPLFGHGDAQTAQANPR